MKIKWKLFIIILCFVAIFCSFLRSTVPVMDLPTDETIPQLQVTEPTPPPTQATQPPTDPTEPPTQPPTEAPTQPPTEATTPPTEPTKPTTPPAATQPSSSRLTASHAFIYDYDAQSLQVLRGSMTDSIDPASITKLFTAYIALELLEPSHVMTVGNIIKTVPADSSFAWVHVGDVMTVEEIIAGMLLPSGGDAARALAAEAGRAVAQDPYLNDTDAYNLYLDHMNQWLAAHGMTGTHFANVDGYPKGDRYSCMQDILQMAKLCFEHPLIRQIMGTAKYTVTLPDRTLTWENTNQHLHTDSKFYISTVIGMKTGYTPKAGRCLLSVFCIDGEYTIVGVFGCPESSKKGIAQFENTAYIYETYLAS